MKKRNKQFNTHFNFAILAIVTVGFLLWHTIAIFNLEQDLANLQTNITIPTKNNTEDATQQGTDTQNNEDTAPQILYNEDGSIDTSNWKEYCNQEYGFCVKYPEGWEYRDIKKDDKVWSMGLGKHGKYYEIEGGGDNAVSISISPAIQQNNNTVPHILRVWQDSYDITINKVKINDMVGYYYSGFGEGIIFPNILNHKDVKISSIIMTTPKIKHNIQPVLQNIINSFKSIK